jgi:hypothetical protein
LEGISRDFLRVRLHAGMPGAGATAKLDAAFWAGEFAKAKLAAKTKGEVGPGEWVGAWGQEMVRVIRRSRKYSKQPRIIPISPMASEGMTGA